MNDCLSKEELELLSKREFRGKGLFKALKHLENCEKCRSQVSLPTTEEIMKRFEDEDNTSSPRPSALPPLHKN